MIKPAIVACEILKDEVELLITKHNLDKAYDVIWLPEALHNRVNQLKTMLQETIDKNQERPYLLFVYGNCGNAFTDLEAGKTKLVIPKYDDCIAILLCDDPKVNDKRTHTMFTTKCMMDGKEGMEQEYHFIVERYGNERAQHVIDMMYKNYDTLQLIDTGAFKIDEQLERFYTLAKLYNLSPLIEPGNLSPIEKLFLGEWEEENYVIINPGEKVELDDFFDF